MPKKYYCDVCRCSFPDNQTNRRNHIDGALHQANQRFHYDWFKEPEELIADRQKRSPCYKYMTYGHCPSGFHCMYSHITYDAAGQIILPPDIIEWMQQRFGPSQEAAQTAEAAAASLPQKRYRLPTGWKVRTLPPSLKPPPAKGGFDWTVTASWG
ncbi:hypothetical protein BX666DRAFT_1408880 [Dichotomocladium elegans]|nr:hypothetical protein BX666DRAFT_1408880 [Dichotomocladium elegans]